MEARKAVNKTPWHPRSLPPPRRSHRLPQKQPCSASAMWPRAFGRNEVLRNISLEIAEGEFLTILGESGSGKTTLLRIIAGFETASSGELWMGGERLDHQPPYRRRVNTVFQILRAVSSSHGRTKRGIRTARGETAGGGDSPARRRGAGQSKDDGPRQDEAVKDQRRPAAASCAGTGAGEPPTTAVAG